MKIEDLSDRLYIVLGYAMGALTRSGARREPGQAEDDRARAEQIRELLPYVRALLQVARAHTTEFHALMPTPVVHLLSAGEALCGKPGVPGEWEPWHKWVPQHGAPASLFEINCTECQAKLVGAP